MEIAEVFKSPFNLIFSCPPYFSTLPGIKFILSTEEIADSTTAEEICNISQIYLNSTIAKYNQYQITGEILKKTAYKLFITWKDEKEEWKEKVIYTISYNVEEEKKIIRERKHFNNSETVEGKFFIRIDATIYIFREGHTDPDELEEIEEYQTTQAIKSLECVICYKNPPNVLYTSCLHLAVCNSCDEIGKFCKCPLCRTKIKNQRIKF